MLYVGLKRSRYYWEIVVCARKASIFSLSVIGSANTGLAVQTHLAMGVLMLALVFHLIGRPYMQGWELLNNFETSGLVVCFCMMFSGIVFYTKNVPNWLTEGATVMLALMNFGYTAFTVIVLVRQKGVEDSPINKAKRTKLFCCCSDKAISRVSHYIPAIYDPGQNWMAQSNLNILESESQKMLNFNPSFRHNKNMKKKSTSTPAVALNSTLQVDTKNVLASLELATLNTTTDTKNLESGIITLPKGWE